MTLPAVGRDVLYGCRKYLRHPWTTLMIVVCIAVGSGANAALFTVARAVLLRPLPFATAEALVTANIEDGRQGAPFSVAEINRLRDQIGSLVELSARAHSPVSVQARGTATRVAQGEFVSSNYFELLQQPVAHGRTSDRQPTGIVLSDHFWRTQFSADPTALGQSLLLNGTPVDIIGIAPPGFNGAMQLVSTDLWVPLSEAPRILNRQGLFDEPWVGLIGRLRDNISLAQLQAAADVVASRVVERQRTSKETVSIAFGPAEGVGAPPALRSMIGATFAAVWIVAGALLLIATANAAGLMLVAGIRREPEMVVRLALGASARRLALQLTAEAAILVVLGTAASLILTDLVIRVAGRFADMASGAGGIALDLRVDSRALAFTLLVSALATVAAALAPVRHSLMLKDSAVLRTATASPSRRTHRVLNTLAAVQVACTLAPTAILGVVVGDLMSPPDGIGLDPERVSAFTLDLQQSKVPSGLVMQRMQSATRGPDVGVAWTTRAPLLGRPPRSVVAIRSGTEWRELQAATVDVSLDYFAVLRVTVQAGRAFEPGDDTLGAAIVSQRFAEIFGDQRALLGTVVRIGSGSPLRVVGIVDDIQYGSAVDAAAPVVYRPLAGDQHSTVTMVTNSGLPYAPLADTIRQQLDTISGGRATVSGVSLRRRIDDVYAARQRFAGVLIAAAAVSIVLSVCGLGLVVAYIVQTRLREFALRKALGAASSDIAARVLRQASAVAGAGAAMGVILSAAFLRVLGSAIVGLENFSVAVILVPSITLIVIVVLGTLEPLWQAVRAEPSELLRMN